MAESLFASLLSTFDKSNVTQIAGLLGQSEQSVSRGMESSIASVLGAVASKAGDPDALRKTLDLVPDSAVVSWPALATSLSGIGSPWITKGKQMLAALFGSGGMTAANAVGRESHLGMGTATTLLSMAAPMVLNFLGRRVRDQGLSMTSLGAMLQSESATIRKALPAGLSEMLWPEAALASTTSTGITQRKRNYPGWLSAVGVGVLVLACFWLWNHLPKRAAETSGSVSGTASRMANEDAGLGEFVNRGLPNGVELNVPAGGVESNLLGILNGNPAGRKSWLDFDRLKFDAGSSTPGPGSKEQLDDIAAILKAYPKVQLRIAGFTDSAGSEERNLGLSRARAESVRNELVARGIAADRLTAQGFGEATTDNDSAGGRARNRRVSLQVKKM